MGNCFSTAKRKLKSRSRRRETQVFAPLFRTALPRNDSSESQQWQRIVLFFVASLLQRQYNANHGLSLPGGLFDPDRLGGESELNGILRDQFYQLRSLTGFPWGHRGERNANSHHSPTSSNDFSASQHNHPTLEKVAAQICQLFQGEELGSWGLTDHVDRAWGKVEEDDPFEPLQKLSKFADFRRMPYHDPTETVKYHMAKLQKVVRFLQSHRGEIPGICQRVVEALEALDGEESDEDQDMASTMIIFLCRMIRDLFTNNDAVNALLGFFMHYLSLVELELELPVIPELHTLQQVHELGPTFLTTSGENGYTEIFQGGTEYNIIDIKKALHTRNKTPATVVERDIITLAISYKHSGQGSKRICKDDLEAIASFIKASRHCRIRFWIDTKLPPTDDGSFERWLKRGMRPYARYLTLICPSTHSMAHRFWIANERVVAVASRGIFEFEGQGIYFSKGLDHFRELGKRMLTLVIGGQGLPEGVRQDEEGKASQWALGILGSEQNFVLLRACGPKIDELHMDDFCENKAMLQIEDIVRHDGPITLPLVAGRTWNRQNPLMKGTSCRQEHQMKNWIGLCNVEDKRLVYFLHMILYPEVTNISVTSVVLRVRLRVNYDSTSRNEIEEKVLMEVPNEDLRRMLPVTVPIESDWSVFSDEQALQT